MNYGERHDAQVAHIFCHRDRFKDHAGYVGDRDEISTYLIDYAGEHHDVYQRLCHDLGIEPIAAICHPDPYGDTEDPNDIVDPFGPGFDEANQSRWKDET